MPPSSLPEAADEDAGDDDGDDNTDATSDTVPLGSNHGFGSDSDLTEEEDEEEGEELPGPPIGIRPVATPTDSSNVDMDDEATPLAPYVDI